jgi:hypothetical protein
MDEKKTFVNLWGELITDMYQMAGPCVCGGGKAEQIRKRQNSEPLGMTKMNLSEKMTNSVCVTQKHIFLSLSVDDRLA